MKQTITEILLEALKRAKDKGELKLETQPVITLETPNTGSILVTLLKTELPKVNFGRSVFSFCGSFSEPVFLLIFKFVIVKKNRLSVVLLIMLKYLHRYSFNGKKEAHSRKLRRSKQGFKIFKNFRLITNKRITEIFIKNKTAAHGNHYPDRFLCCLF